MLYSISFEIISFIARSHPKPKAFGAASIATIANKFRPKRQDNEAASDGNILTGSENQRRFGDVDEDPDRDQLAKQLGEELERQQNQASIERVVDESKAKTKSFGADALIAPSQRSGDNGIR